MMHFPVYMLATCLVASTVMAFAPDEPQPDDRASRESNQTPASSTFGGVRRSGIAPFPPGTRLSTEAVARQERKSVAALKPGVTSNGNKKKSGIGAERGRTAIPPPVTTWPSAGARRQTPASDLKLRRVQAQPGRAEMIGSPLPGSSMNIAQPGGPRLANTLVGGQPIAMQAALYGAITGNPDLVTLREGNALAASAEAVETARHFPTTLNPTLWIDYRPITLVPNGTFGTGPGRHASAGGNNYYHFGQDYIYVSLRQPVELGHQTTHRYHIAQAAYEQQKWIVVQAELTALVQTYRFFQTAAYRREKYRLAKDLAVFNDRLQETLERRMQANQVMPADVALGRVEARATRLQETAARQDYFTALTDLRNQIGISDAAGAVEPLGEFTVPPYIPPLDEQAMVDEAMHQRPDIQAAAAQVAGTHSAVRLARGDQIPTPIIGPEYQMDEAGVQYVGFVLISPIPIWNNGRPLVLQREAEHRRAIVAYKEAQQRAAAQVRAAVAKWNGATDLVNNSAALSKDLSDEVKKMETLFDQGAADLTKLMQARQRLMQLENSRLDALWQATQSQADLLLALGIPSLINDMVNRSERDDMRPPSAPPSSGRGSQGVETREGSKSAVPAPLP